MNLGIKRTWTGNIITKLDIKMMKGAMKDVYFLASFPISSQIHFKAYMHATIDLWKILEFMNIETFIDYIGGTDMYFVPLSIYAIEQRVAREGGSIIERFNDLQTLIYDKFCEVEDMYPNIAGELEYYLEKEIDAICEHLDIGAIYKKLRKGGEGNAS